MIGAQHMAHLCRELERVVYADDFKSADVVMSDLDAEFARIRRVLEAKRQGSSS